MTATAEQVQAARLVGDGADAGARLKGRGRQPQLAGRAGRDLDRGEREANRQARLRGRGGREG